MAVCPHDGMEVREIEGELWSKHFLNGRHWAAVRNSKPSKPKKVSLQTEAEVRAELAGRLVEMQQQGLVE